ncbi:hypothetical protein MMC30_003204 [Trapelia coarctata]|nr:hypothetical protein [Trapelia coarctata]
MATDRSLATLLRALQSPSTEQVASRLINSATTLLTLLSNPLNVALLTSQILIAPAVWQSTNGVQTSFRILGVFNAASLRKIQQEDALQSQASLLAREGLRVDEWVKAVVQGADDRSPRWKHMLVLGGLLIGFERHNHHGLSSALRRNLGGAMVRAANLALQEVEGPNDESASVICIVLGYIFEILEDSENKQIDRDLLLPLLIESTLFSRNGLHWGYFLGSIDVDIIQDGSNRFNWSPQSSTYLQIKQMTSRPMIASLGSLSRLISLCVANVKDADRLIRMSDNISSFTRSLCIQWQQNKLSEVDAAEESRFLTELSLKSSLPLLWQILKSALFAVVVMQASLLGRVIGDGHMPVTQAPLIAIQTLHSLRNLYFISSRLGQNPFSQHTFLYMTCIDILSRYPAQAEAFLRDIQPADATRIPEHPQQRCLDLYFLNTAEHFAFFLPSICESLLIQSATPYLATGNDPRLLEVFEAAHSVMLAVFACPQNQFIVVHHLPNYIENLFAAFPHSLSGRQFRLAIKTLVRVTAPPSPISETQPLLSSTLLDLVHSRVGNASSERLPSPVGQGDTSDPTPLSEQATLVMTLIDSLSFLPIPVLEEWMAITAEAINLVETPDMLSRCRERFWEVMSNGEMDVARAQVCVIWWNTKGGREMVFGASPPQDQGPFMSGALGEVIKL